MNKKKNRVASGHFYPYDFVNRYNSMFSPSTVHCANAALTWYFRKYLLEQVMSRYEFDIPENWNKSYFLYTLFCRGVLAVIKTDKYGIICQNCTLGGYDIYYQPVRAIISNPHISRSVEARIGVNTELIKLQPNYTGIMDIVNLYADMMSLTVETIGTNLVNSKLAYVFAAGDKAQAETMKALYDDIMEGNPAAVADKKLFGPDGKLLMQYFTQDLRQNFITPELLETLRRFEQKFMTDVGFPNVATDKKERLLVDEVNMNNEETLSKATLWLETMQESMDRVNSMFGLDLAVRFRRIEGGGADEQAGIDASGGGVQSQT